MSDDRPESDRQSADASEGPREESTETRGPSPVPGSLPKMIGQFHVKDVLASGGMGTVYRAVQEHPRRTVAVKVMKHGIASRSAMRRFEYESQILARLHHPGIAQVYEAGTHDDGTGAVPFFAMEYIPNARTITKYAREKKLSTRQRLELFAHVCDAVHHGHQKGIVHRDLKPGNILVDSHGEVKIIDFGVARGTDSDMAVTTVQTDVGQLLGTLQYMSPEQCAADPHDIDTRSDVYALGVVLYELLSGKLPYDVKNRPVYETTRVIREQPPTRLSTGDTTLKGDIETIVLKALEKDRDRRYQSTDELRRDIEHHLQGEPISARPPSVAYQLRVFARRNKTLFGAIAAVFVVLVAGVIATTSMYVGARREAAKAEATHDFLGGMLRTVDPTEARGRELTVNTILDEAAQKIAKGTLADQPLVEASVRDTIGRTYMSLALYDVAEPHLATALAIRRRVLGDEHRDTLQSACFQAELLWKQRDYEAAESLVWQTLETQRRVLGPEDQDTIYSMLRLGAVLGSQWKSTEAEAVYSPALELARRVLGDGHQTTLMLMVNLGGVYVSQWDFDNAVRLDRRALRLQRRVLGAEHPITLMAMNNLSIALRLQGQIVEAEQLAREALDTYRRVLGDDHPDTLGAVTNVAAVLSVQGKLDEAEELAAGALRKLRSLDEEDPETLGAMTDFVDVLKSQGKLDEAEELATHALNAARRVRGEDHPDTFFPMWVLSITLWERGKLAEGKRVYERLGDTLGRALGEEHLARAQVGSTGARGLWHLGKLTEAEELGRRALEIFRRDLGEEDPRTLIAMHQVADTLLGQGKLTEAEALYRRTLDLRRRVLGAGHDATLETGWDLARVLFYRGNVTEARPLINRFRAALRSGAEGRDLTQSILNVIAWDLLIGACGPVDPSDVETALRLAQRGVTMPGVQPALVLDTLALAQKMTGDVDKAVETQRQALAGLSTEESDTRAALQARLIGYLRESGDHEAADLVLRDALATVRSAHGDRHAELVRQMTELALALLAQGKYALHEDFCVPLTQVRQGIVPQGEPGIANLVVVYAGTLVDRGEYAEAEELLRRCLDIRKLAHGDTDWRTAHVMGLLGESLTGQDNFDEAEPLLLDGYSQMSDYADTIPEQHRDDRIREALERLVNLYESWGKPDQAAKYRATLDDGE